jgi:hypothetical protein
MNQIERLPISINLGCGEQGLEWSNARSSGGLNFGLDHHRLISRQNNYLIAEAFNLPIASDSVDRLFADYYFNPIGNEAISDFTKNPDIFLGNKYSSKLKDWYTNNMHGDKSLAEQNLLQIRNIQRTISLREVVRILAPKGTITVIDHAHVGDWIEEQLKYSKTLTVRVACLTQEDFNRSVSLNKLYNQGAPVRKLIITKN